MRPVVKSVAGATARTEEPEQQHRLLRTTDDGDPDPAWNAQHKLSEISNTRVTDMELQPRNPAMTYDGDWSQDHDCAIRPRVRMEEIQNFANWFTYYRSREYTAKAALSQNRVRRNEHHFQLCRALNDANERLPVASMNASYRVGNKKTMMNQIYKVDSNNGAPLRTRWTRLVSTECRSGGSGPNTSPGDSRCPVMPSPEGQCPEQLRAAVLGRCVERVGDRHNERLCEQRRRQYAVRRGGKCADTLDRTLADVAMYYYERDLHPSPDERADRNETPLGARMCIRQQRQYCTNT